MNPGDVISFDQDVAISGAACFDLDNCGDCKTLGCDVGKVKVGEPVFVLDGRNSENEMLTLISYDGGFYTIVENAIQDANISVLCKLDKGVMRK